MIQYNNTTKMDPAFAGEWLEWHQLEQKPAIMATGCFDSYHIYKLLGQDEQEGITYIVQLTTDSPQRFSEFEEKFESALLRLATGRWGFCSVSFQSHMELVK